MDRLRETSDEDWRLEASRVVRQAGRCLAAGKSSQDGCGCACPRMIAPLIDMDSCEPRQAIMNGSRYQLHIQRVEPLLKLSNLSDLLLDELSGVSTRICTPSNALPPIRRETASADT